jgi:hypothetical protein
MNKLFTAKTLLVATVFLSSCAGVKVTQIGKLNMISNRNVDSKMDYSLLKNYMGASNKEIKKAKATTLEDAIDETVRNTSGGEFLKNVKVYLYKIKRKCTTQLKAMFGVLKDKKTLEDLLLATWYNGKIC